MTTPSGFLEWDSDFFHRNIAFIDGANSNNHQIRQDINHYLEIGAECIYLFNPILIDLSDKDSVLVDKKRTYILSNPKLDFINHPLKFDSLIYNGDPSDLYDLALQSGEHSRFKIDPHFSDEEFSLLYKKWIDNSVDKGFADYVIVALDPDPIGFITAKIKEDKIIVGLFATDVKHRGKGIGRFLMQKIINIAAEKELKVEVVTQADNKVACSFYEKMGFLISDESYVYHIWNSNKH